ncbi:hypothetical protein NKG94_02565 [Micromonospora sp. M12]
MHRSRLEWWRTWFGQAEQIGVPVSWPIAAERFGADRVAYLGDYLDTFLAAAGDDPGSPGTSRAVGTTG